MTSEEYIQQAEAIRARLISVAQRYLGATDEAEDLVQDAMLKLWLIREQLDPAFEGMACIVTRNLCIDYLRRRHPQTDIAQLAEAEDISDDGEQIEQMLHVIDGLPSTQRTILKMRHIDGMEMREIAMVLGATEVAVRKTLSRARKEVRRKMTALLAAVCLVAAISGLAVHWLSQKSVEDECVAYIYGKKYTDEHTVMTEMKRTMGEVVEDNPQDEIEQQLNELFSE